MFARPAESPLNNFATSCPKSDAAGKELVYLELQMYVGAKDPADTIELIGHPNVKLVIPGGSPADITTASVVVNTIPAILDAPAGLRTSRDLLIGFFSPLARP